MTTSTTTVQLQEDLSSGDQNAHPSPSRTTPSVGDTKEDARVVIKLFGTWVDVTAWLNDHPGGSKVLRAFNKKDATDAVMAMHTDEAIKRIIRFSNGVSSAPINASIGDVQTIEKSLSREQLMYYKLRTHARNQGWFQSNLFYEGVKAMIAFGLLIIGFATLYFDYGIWSTALIGFAWFQLGWLGHDWSHHTALPKSTTNCANYNDYLGWLTGLARGNTLLWWKLRHNTHHVLTNQYENDPDILTQPPLHFFEDFDVGNVNRYQAVYYLPMLTLLHLFWLYESVLVCLRQSKSINRYNRMHARRDTVALVLHILIVGIISYTSGKYLLILLAYMLSGFLTAVVVFASHYNEPRVASGESLSLVRQTLLTTINIGSFSDTHWEKKLWFYLTGGLNMQIEHHLFPTMPRHNLPKTTFLVKSLAQELGLPYKETNIVSLTKAAVTTLHHNALRNIERLLARGPFSRMVLPRQEICIDGRIYDVTEFINRHPGGKIILFQVGADATDAFREFHAGSEKAEKILKTLPSRDDDGTFLPSTQRSIMDDFKRLRDDLVSRGVFKPSVMHVVYRCLEVVALYLIGFYLALCTSNVYVGCAVLGVAQGRAGWLMHEGGHHSLTGNWKVDQFLQELFFGIGCGMSAAWWRNAHNKHHAAPQHLGKDVDLETLPLVAFNKAVLRGRLPSVWIRSQAVCFAPISTLLVSFFWQFYLHPRHIIRTGRRMESFWLLVRYLVIVYLGFSYGLVSILLCYIASVHVGGMYIFVHFALSHTHLPVINQNGRANWLEYASKHTVNVSTNNYFVTWLMSYLNYQIEHHLFPSCPQFRFPGYVSMRVREFFHKHGLKYNEVGYLHALNLTFSNLAAVAIVE